MDRLREYVFRVNSEATLREWASVLECFRFCRAIGGHANDGDLLSVAFRWTDESALRRFFEFLSVPVAVYEEEPPRAMPGVAHRAGEFPSIVPGTRWIKQPGFCAIGGHQAFVWCDAERVKISVSNGYEVDASSVAIATELEKTLRGAPLELTDPPLDDPRCICPQYYPDFFG